MKIILACALLATALPASAQDVAHGPHQVSAALKSGCSVQQTHLPAGKTGTAPAIIRCAEARPEQLASRSVTVDPRDAQPEARGVD